MNPLIFKIFCKIAHHESQISNSSIFCDLMLCFHISCTDDFYDVYFRVLSSLTDLATSCKS